MEISNTCPRCNHSNALMKIGSRADRPYRWRRWIVTTTEIFLCTECAEIIEYRSGQLVVTESRTPRTKTQRQVAA